MIDPNEGNFIEALMRHILDHAKTPKVQVERVIGPILGMFIAEVLSASLDDCLELISPEFPLRKTLSTYQSTNIDWLLYSTKHDQLVFLELKTTDTTFDREQAEIYFAVIRKIKEVGSSFLVSDVKKIGSVSEERGKYEEVLSRIARNERYAKCRNARLVYLAPKMMGDATREILKNEVEWLSFQDLPGQISSRFAREWGVIRKHLVELDSITRRSRNGLQDNYRQQNFAGVCRFEEVISLCWEHQDTIVVGFEGGTSKLDAANLAELKGRSHYKWDYAEKGTGFKDPRNWISGGRFLEIAEKVRSSGTRAESD